MPPRGIAQPIAADEWFKDLLFPVGGTDLSRAFGDQQAKEMPNREWGRTTRLGRNVRGFEPETGRGRGGQRPGLEKYISTPVVTDWLIQELATIVTTGSPVQRSQSGRVVTLVAVSQGNVYRARAGDTAWTQATNASSTTPPLNFSGVVYSTPLNQKLWFADGIHYRYYDPSANTVNNWQATAGTLPVDNQGNTPRLCGTWRGRLVVSGLLFDPQNWFMSKVSDPQDWDYFPTTISPDQAIAGNNSPLGLVGDVITTLIPYTDDVLIFGGDHSIYMLRGDPMAGGQIDRVTDAIGMAWGMPWAMDPYGTIYFVSNKTGIYSMVPGEKPVRISQPIEQLLQAYNTGEMTIRMIWNDKYQGLHVFITNTLAAAVTTHFFYEHRTGAWWLDQYANNDHNPLACCAFDGNLPDDRAALIGGWDGYVRSLSTDATDDDGTAIASTVVIGPLNTKDLDELLIKDLQCVMGENSEDVLYSVHVGTTAEEALSSNAVATGTWSAGRNSSNLIRRSGHALYVKITATDSWSMEQIRARIAGSGKVRRRA